MQNRKFYLTLIIALVLQLGYSQNKDMFFKEANTFFKTYVMHNNFNYIAARNSPMLDVFLNDIATTDLESLDPAVRKAYMINAYNLLVVNQVVQNYPITSVQDVNGFFDKKIHTVGGEKMSLNQFEKESILGFDQDPRYHFVLVCGAVACPPITNFAYMPGKLEAQMEAQTKSALNNQDFLKRDGSQITINQIFNWYALDFGSNKNDRIAFINTYLDKPIPADSKFKFSNYDWTLNEESSRVSVGGTGANASRYVVSSTIPKGTAEIKLFNNLYTQRGERDVDGSQRNNFFTSTLSALYGVNSRFNAGIELKYRRVSNTLLPSSPLTVFSNDDTDLINRRARFTGFGPKIRWAPTAALPNFSIQSTFQFALGEELQGNNADNPFIDWNGAIWYTQFFNDIPIGNRFSVFTEIDVWIEDIGSSSEGFINRVSTPAILIFSYFPNPKTTIYALGGYSPFWQQDFDYFYQVGGGVKYQFNPNFELELLITDFSSKFLAAENGQAATFNLGIRYNL
jgi:hypothetical protein